MIGNIFLSSPFAWICLSAVFFGMALSRATFRVKNREDRHRAIAIKWSFVSIYLSISIVFILCAVFVPGPEKILNEKLLYLFGVVSVLSLFAFRFKRSFGSLLFFGFIVVSLSIFFFLKGFNAFTGEEEIAVIRVLDVSDEKMILDVMVKRSSERDGYEERVITLKGNYFAPIVKEIIFDDYFVFLGFKTWYRFVGITAFRFIEENGRRVLKQTDVGFYFKNPIGISESLYELFERHEDAIPGVKSVQIDITAKRARRLRSYSVRIQNDGGMDIVNSD